MVFARRWACNARIMRAQFPAGFPSSLAGSHLVLAGVACVRRVAADALLLAGWLAGWLTCSCACSRRGVAMGAGDLAARGAQPDPLRDERPRALALRLRQLRGAAEGILYPCGAVRGLRGQGEPSASSQDTAPPTHHADRQTQAAAAGHAFTLSRFLHAFTFPPHGPAAVTSARIIVIIMRSPSAPRAASGVGVD
jgi:hypothetical protein|eukprot:COSAG01_NODE_4349_length_5115_cov_2.076555_6_plen_195_part_00